MKRFLLLAGLVWIAMGDAANAAPQIRHDADKKCVTMTDGQGDLTLRPATTAAACWIASSSAARRSFPRPPGSIPRCAPGTYGGEDHDYSTCSGIQSPREWTLGRGSVSVSGIRFGGHLTQVEKSAGRLRCSRTALIGGSAETV